MNEIEPGTLVTYNINNSWGINNIGLVICSDALNDYYNFCNKNKSSRPASYYKVLINGKVETMSSHYLRSLYL